MNSFEILPRQQSISQSGLPSFGGLNREQSINQGSKPRCLKLLSESLLQRADVDDVSVTQDEAKSIDCRNTSYPEEFAMNQDQINQLQMFELEQLEKNRRTSQCPRNVAHDSLLVGMNSFNNPIQNYVSFGDSEKLQASIASTNAGPAGNTSNNQFQFVPEINVLKKSSVQSGGCAQRRQSKRLPRTSSNTSSKDVAGVLELLVLGKRRRGRMESEFVTYQQQTNAKIEELREKIDKASKQGQAASVRRYKNMISAYESRLLKRAKVEDIQLQLDMRTKQLQLILGIMERELNKTDIERIRSCISHEIPQMIPGAAIRKSLADASQLKAQKSSDTS